MNLLWNEFGRRNRRKSWRCFADGGTAAHAGEPDPKPAPEPATPPEPKKEEMPEKTHTAADIETAKQQAIEEYKHHLEEAKDYEKMTAEEKVVYLEQQRVEDKLAQYAAAKLSALELPTELLPFVKGKDEANTDEQIKTFKAAYDKGVQAGVEKRFKANGYLPRGSAVGKTEKEETKRQRGVSVK